MNQQRFSFLLPFCLLRNSEEEATRVDYKEQIFPREPLCRANRHLFSSKCNINLPVRNSLILSLFFPFFSQRFYS